MNRTTIIKTKYLYIGGISIFLIGLMLGVVLLLVNFRLVIHALKPKPPEMAEMLASRITKNISKDFALPEEAQSNIKNIILSSQPKIDKIFKNLHEELGTFKSELIKRIAEEIPDAEDRRILLADPDKYFPSPPKDGAPPPPPPPPY